MAHNLSKLRRIWILYGLFFVIMLLCLVLFFTNIISSDEPSIFNQIDNLVRNPKQYAIGVTDLYCNDHNDHTYLVAGTNDDVCISAKVKKYDIAVVTDNATNITSPLTTWTVVLQSFSAIAIMAIFVLIILLMISFYKSIKEGRIFQKRGIKWVWFIGILMFLMSLSTDLSIYLERQYAFTLLANTDWVPDNHFSIHFTRIFFSVIIMFVAEILNIGHGIQQEQDLTI